jgi:hypothetical protein
MREAADKALNNFFTHDTKHCTGSWDLWVKKVVQGQDHNYKNKGWHFRATAFKDVKVRVW